MYFITSNWPNMSNKVTLEDENIQKYHKFAFFQISRVFEIAALTDHLFYISGGQKG